MGGGGGGWFLLPLREQMCFKAAAKTSRQGKAVLSVKEVKLMSLQLRELPLPLYDFSLYNIKACPATLSPLGRWSCVGWEPMKLGAGREVAMLEVRDPVTVSG